MQWYGMVFVYQVERREDGSQLAKERFRWTAGNGRAGQVSGCQFVRKFRGGKERQHSELLPVQ